MMIAACGLDCSGCNLFCAVTDERAAQSLVSWFRQEGWLKPDEGGREIMCRGPYCKGCHGDRSVQWSGDCWIRKCCVDDRKLRFCSDCSEFPCEMLAQWSKTAAKYTTAFNRLLSMRKSHTMGKDVIE
jgi:hypothetical protein